MASEDPKADAELRAVLEKNKTRRERLKLEILASLRTPPKKEERPVTARGRRMTSEAVLDEPVRRSEPKTDTALLTLPARVLLERNLYRGLAEEKERRANKVKAVEEIAKLKAVHAQARQDIKQQVETIKVSRAKNRRMRRILQALQLRLVASALVLQHQMDRRLELAHQLENIIYYRNAVMDNAFAFLFGSYKIDTTVPLGGVFSPYAYLDMDEEEEKNDREIERLLTLTPPAFKSSAQQRRVSFRNALAEGLAAFAHPDLIGHGRTASVDYSALSKLSHISSAGGNLTPRSVASTSDLSTLMSGGSTPPPHSEHKRGPSDEGLPSSSHGDSVSPVRRVKGLKPSASAGPSTRTGDSPQTKKQSGGLFGLFSNKQK